MIYSIPKLAIPFFVIFCRLSDSLASEWPFEYAPPNPSRTFSVYQIYWKEYFNMSLCLDIFLIVSFHLLTP
uniref:Putative secreted protein n=1 Tax=Anopheles triannulatus TaxID=58253 RepID=A0A2M4B5U1_9DIPT